MSDDLTRAIAEALGCDVTIDDEGGYYCSEHGEYLDHTGQCQEPERIAAALAPLIEARVREARADALAEVAEALRESALTVERTKGASQRTWFMREMVGVLTNRAREVRR